ncbi:MAG TPA: BON domain-containing protein [Candidatus Angelobacter sp.]|nr:BON domain-containing protein [Candidatus Angelobacter sp.]
MRLKTAMAALASLLLALAMGCTSNKASTPDVKDQVTKALDNAGYKDLKIDVNHDKELVTLTGDVKTQEDKDHAEDLAKAAASGYVISNEIGVRPEGVENAARKIDSNVDDAIEKDFKAVMIANRLDAQSIRYNAKNGVLTLKGNVDTPALRDKAEKLAASVPNVQQVVNELDVKGKRRPSGM